MKPEVRLAQRKDLPALVSLLSELGEASLEVLEVVWNQVALCPCTRVYVVEQEGEVVATYTLHILPNLGHGGQPIAVMEGVSVARDRRGRGLGSLMVQHALEEAKRAGAYKLALSSASHRKEAHAFYERLGFRVYGVALAVEIR